MKKTIITIALSMIIILILVITSFGLGIVDLKFYEFFGVRKANIERQVFKENKTYVEGMASDLAKYRFELQKENDETAKEAIKDLIRSKYADFDITKLQDSSLQIFLREVRGGY